MAGKNMLQQSVSLSHSLRTLHALDRPIEHPMWKFMKGIEGFDITRATECLEKLIYAHYDTMSVLMLVTKQDLIEDADLKPGDALRIVSAIKELTPDTLKRACESPESCEQKRAKVVNQDTGNCEGQGGAIQVGEETGKQANEPAQTIPVGAKQANETAQTIPCRPKRTRACGVCNCRCNSDIDMRNHFKGQRHAYHMGLATKNDDNSYTAYLWCSICDVTCSGKKQPVEHFNGMRHRSRCGCDLGNSNLGNSNSGNSDSGNSNSGNSDSGNFNSVNSDSGNSYSSY